MDKADDKGFPAGRKHALAAAVSYQDGSVVSREIISRRAGTVTIFAFDRGEGLSEHTAPYDALLQILEGEAVVTVAGSGNRMKAGDGIILPAGKPHSVEAASKFKMLLTMIRS